MNKNIKLIVAFLIITFGIYLLFNREIAWGIVLLVLSIIPIILYFRNEYILLAFWQLRKQNLVGAQKWLNKITNPESQLFKQQHGYFQYLNGVCIAQENPAKAEGYMRKALQLGLLFDHDKALASVNLAVASLSKGKKAEAEKYLIDAKKYDKQNMLGEQIKMIKEQMKKVNIGKNIQNPNMRNRGKYF